MEQKKHCPKCMAEYPESVRFCGACGTHLETGVKPRMVSDTLIGTLVGNRFVVIEKLAQGGMGVVYRAEQTGIWRQVALKVLRPRYSGDKSIHERFRIEAATASKLSHPNTITIYDFGFTDDRGLYIAMELLDGLSLDQEIAKNGALDWRRACRIAVQICGSLQEAHEFNILHRDLKPENIMLTRRGNERDVVKVLDFGIAKIMIQEGDTARPALTAGNELFGTPEYMSPEQIRGDVLDNRSDIYSLGVILYRMLSGAQPFDAPTPIAVLTKHLTETPAPPVAPPGRKKIPSELVVLTASCLAKGRDDRPESMQQVGETLLGLLDETMPVMLLGGRQREMPAKNPALGATRPDGAPPELGSPLYHGRRPPALPRQDETPMVPVAEPLGGALSPKSGVAAAAEGTSAPRTDLALDKTLLDASRPTAPEPEIPESTLSEPEPSPERPTSSADAAIEESAGPQSVSALRESTLKELRARMKRQRDFPALSQNVVELNTKAQRQDTSARMLSNVILRDYALTSKLLRLVNSPFYGQYRGKVMTVSRAVVIMGFEQVRQIAFGLMMFDRIERTDPRQARALKDEALFSLASGLLARRIAEQGGNVDPEAALIGGMFHRLGKYIAYFYFPQKGKEIRRLIQKSKMDDETASLKILGISFHDLGRWMIREWQLPDQFGDAMGKLSKGPISKPKTQTDRLRCVVGFADELTACGLTGEKGNRKHDIRALARRFEKAAAVPYERLDELLVETVDEVKEWSKLLALNLRDSAFMARMVHWNGLGEMPDVPEERFSDAPISAGQQVEPVEAETDALTEKKQIFQQGIEEITLAMTSRYDLNGIILMVLETIYRGLALSRVVFFLNDVKSGTMTARSGFGDDVDELLQKFRFQPSRGRDLFNQAAWFGKDVIVNDTSIPRVQERLPAWYRRTADASAIILYPVMLRQVTAGLFYGDLLNPNCRINRGLLVYVDKLRKLTARAVREKGLSGG